MSEELYIPDQAASDTLVEPAAEAFRVCCSVPCAMGIFCFLIWCRHRLGYWVGCSSSSVDTISHMAVCGMDAAYLFGATVDSECVAAEMGQCFM
jgi:hypothetical protein